MYPQTYLKTFWRLELRSQVFVAMSFAPQYEARFKEIIAPAIQSIVLEGSRLEPYRVDISKSGDSILTDISDGIAHSRLVLADISSIGKDSVTGLPYRNGNVMYEVGVALACRQPSEVLLVRDDHDKFLFDVSTIPHVTINFTNKRAAVQTLAEQILSRVNEQQFINDARVQIAISSLSAEEIILLKQMQEYSANMVWGREVKGLANWYALAISRLLDKGVIKLAGEFKKNKPAFAFTPFGYIVHQVVNSGLCKFEAKMPEPPAEALPETGDEAQQNDGADA
ncbi:MAG: hypothetical protein LWX51_09005 [Deltaproteobacteria bacterium]|nr:hypothetical protein [Deltaproteobacteria bacterium]